MPVTGRSQRFPLRKVDPSEKVFTVSWQLFPHRPQSSLRVSCVKVRSFSASSTVLTRPGSALPMPYSAAP